MPTSLTFLCVLVTWTPWYHNRALRTIQAGLSRETGLIVEIEDFQRASPSTIHLHDVRVLEPETGWKSQASAELAMGFGQ